MIRSVIATLLLLSLAFINSVAHAGIVEFDPSIELKYVSKPHDMLHQNWLEPWIDQWLYGAGEL